MVPDADYRIKLPVFEGPLDLLLFLIKKNEIDIYDIPIVSVTRQYIDVLHSLRQLDLDIAGEFFVMAATLMEIKSRMLLPRGQAAVDPDATEDEMDPRWELVHQLLQYKKFKEAATKLDQLAIFQRDLLARHVSELSVSESDRPLKTVDRIELWNAFNIVLRRLAEKLVVGQIQDEQITVSDKMEEILGFIRTRKTFVFTELFGDQVVTVRLLVATFIAVLELTRLGKLRVRQNDAFTDIECSARDDSLPPHVPDAPDFYSPGGSAARPLPVDNTPPAAVVVAVTAPETTPATDSVSSADTTLPPSDDSTPITAALAEDLSSAPIAVVAVAEEPPVVAPESAANLEKPLETQSEANTVNL